jgi:hypothetical protein
MSEGGSCKHDGADRRIARQPRQRFEEAFHHRGREGVEPIRPVESKSRDSFRDRFEKMLFHADAPVDYLTPSAALLQRRFRPVSGRLHSLGCVHSEQVITGSNIFPQAHHSTVRSSAMAAT